VPSQTHEAIVGILREKPTLVATLVADVGPPSLKDYDAIITDSGDLGTAIAPELKADGVLRVERNGKTVLAIVLEVQLHIDPEKNYAWPSYLVGARSRHRCETMLVVVTASDNVAKWARKPLVIGSSAGFLQAVVVASAQMPAIIDAQKADENPELAVLCAITHGHDKDIDQAILIARTAIEAALRLTDHRAQVYYDLIWAALSDEIKEALKMIPQNYQYQHEGLRRAKIEGVAEGEAKGEAKGVAESLVDVLRLRGLLLTAAEREQIHATKDVAQLRRWLETAMSATTVADALKS
jgi:hypothetical protein